MTWLAMALVATGVLVAGLAVRSWLGSDARRDGVLRRRRRRSGPDPMVTLTIQVRLGELAAELRTVSEDPGLYARAHHYRAVQDAYDAMLRDACRIAGLAVVDVPLRPHERLSEDERLREELELSSRGWSW
ncbi:hypothetical protein [Isoptericola sp. AK164]|uniref:hypothetical protein n=1 Tax=Isoptericola sp. AK164 TaxID=3024246 RepID=UPI002418A327|nr:hypothetical protein [Isoptericola sp. AK164]